MTLHTLSGSADPGEPPESSSGETPVSEAIRSIGALVSDSPLAREQFSEARHDQAEAARLHAEASEADQRSVNADIRAAAERRKAGRRELVNRRLGTTLAIVLAVLDALPAYWSAEAFGLGQNSTLILAALLCAALGGAMWLLDLFSSQHRSSALRVLKVALAAGFLTLFVLRLEYLQVASGDSLVSAAIEAAALTAVSAALIAVGFVLLSHRAPKSVASAERHARDAAHSDAAQTATAARVQAAMSRGAFTDTVVTWVLAHQPAGLGHEEFLEAIGQAIDILLDR